MIHQDLTDQANVLLWKPNVFIVLSIILNQGKTKTIPHTVFEIFLNKILDTKRQRFHIHKSFFYSKSLLEIEVVYNGSFKCHEMFSLKVEKLTKKMRGT